MKKKPAQKAKGSAPKAKPKAKSYSLATLTDIVNRHQAVVGDLLQQSAEDMKKLVSLDRTLDRCIQACLNTATKVDNAVEKRLIALENRVAALEKITADVHPRIRAVEAKCNPTSEYAASLSRLDNRQDGFVIMFSQLRQQVEQLERRQPVQSPLTDVELLMLRVFLAAVKGVREAKTSDHYEGC